MNWKPFKWQYRIFERDRWALEDLYTSFNSLVHDLLELEVMGLTKIHQQEQCHL